MASKPANHGKRYQPNEVKKIETRASQGATTPQIANELKRTEDAIRRKAFVENISLNPRD